MKKYLLNTVYVLVYILCVFTPLIFTTLTKEQYEFPKMFFVYFIGVTVLFLTFLLGKPSGFVFAKPAGLFMLSIIFSTLFSNQRFTSIWGYYSRQNGGLMSHLIFFGIYFVVLNFLVKQKRVFVKKILSFTLLPISLYGILQIHYMERVTSTFGQPNWLAAYIVMVFPLLVEQFIYEKSKLLWGAIGFLSLITLVFTGSLSGFIGLMVVSVFFIVKLKVLKYFFILAVAFFVFNFNFFKYRISDALIFSTNPESYNISDSNIIRYGLLKGSLNLFTSKPKNILVGVGLENFAYEYPFFRDNILNYSSEWSFILNKPHNYYIEILVESGLVGFGSYILLMIYTLRSKNKFLIASFLGFYAANFFGWPTVSTSLVFWVLLACREDT